MGLVAADKRQGRSESHEGRIERSDLDQGHLGHGLLQNLMKGELKVPLKERGGPDLDGPVNLP